MLKVSILERNTSFTKILYKSQGLSFSVIVKNNDLTGNAKKDRKLWKARRQENRMVCPIRHSAQKLDLIKNVSKK